MMVDPSFKGISSDPGAYRIYEKNNVLYAEKKGFLSCILAIFSTLGWNSRNYRLKDISAKWIRILSPGSTESTSLIDRIAAYNKKHLSAPIDLPTADQREVTRPARFMEIHEDFSPVNSASPNKGAVIEEKVEKRDFKVEIPWNIKFIHKDESFTFRFPKCESFFVDNGMLKLALSLDEPIDLEQHFSSFPKEAIEWVRDYLTIAKKVEHGYTCRIERLEAASADTLLQAFHLSHYIGVYDDGLTRISDFIFDKLFHFTESALKPLRELYVSEQIQEIFDRIDTYRFTDTAEEAFPHSFTEDDELRVDFFKKNGTKNWAKLGLSCCYLYGLGVPKVKSFRGSDQHIAASLAKAAQNEYFCWRMKGNRFALFINALSAKPSESIQSMQELAERGVLRAKYLTVIAKNDGAVSWEDAEELSEKGFPDAMRLLGDHYFKLYQQEYPSRSWKDIGHANMRTDYEHNKNLQNALMHYKNAADAGDSKAAFNYVQYAPLNNHIEPYQKIWLSNTFLSACEQGELGELLEMSIGLLGKRKFLFKNEKAGFFLMKSLASKNFPPAMYLLGHCYSIGLGTPVSKEKGEIWKKKAICIRAPLRHFSENFLEMLDTWRCVFDRYPAVGSVEFPQL